MRHLRLSFLMLCSLLVSCGLARESYVYKDYVPNVQMSTTVGSVMMGWETGVKNPVYQNIIEGLRKELSYGGLEGNVVHIMYREFTGGGYARPAFNQDIVYDLTTSKTIAFQDVMLEIAEATQSHVTYKITQEPRSVLQFQQEIAASDSIKNARQKKK